MIWAFIPGPIRRAMTWALTGLVLLWAAMTYGKRIERQKSALRAAERIAAAEVKRGRIEDDIQDDVDLVARARRAAIVRPEPEQ